MVKQFNKISKFFVVAALITSTSYAKDTLRVGVIDSGLDINDPRLSSHLCSTGHKDFTGTGLQDNHGHGTHVVGLIQKYAKNANYCIIILKYWDNNAKDPSTYYIRALKEASRLGAKIVNSSGGGAGFIEQEYRTIKSHPNTTYIMAAGNDGLELREGTCGYFPACYRLPNIIAVGALARGAGTLDSSNYGPYVDAWEIGDEVVSTWPNNETHALSGSSMATAIRTGKLIYDLRP